MMSPIPPSWKHHFQATHHRGHWSLQGPGRSFVQGSRPLYQNSQKMSEVQYELKSGNGSKALGCSLLCCVTSISTNISFVCEKLFMGIGPSHSQPGRRIYSLNPKSNIWLKHIETWNHFFFFSDAPVLWYSHSTKIKSPWHGHRTEHRVAHRGFPPWIASEWTEATIPPGWNHRSPGHSSNSLKNLGSKRSHMANGEWRGKFQKWPTW